MMLRRAFPIVLVVLATASCAGSDRAGVRVDTVQANIVFGVKQQEPGEVSAPQAPSYGVAGSGTALPPLRVPSAGKIGFEIPGTAVQSSCPSAPIGAAPSSAAAENASQPPAPGLYRYKIAGSQTFSVNGSDTTTPLSGFEPHLVRNVQRTSDTLWTYEVVTPNASGGTDVVTWSVNTKPIQRTANVSVGKEVTAGEPARGVALAQINTFDGNGNNTASFRPTPAILELPLPVLPGADFNSVGVDSKSGQSEQVTGIVQDRQTVDACGTLVDGWLSHLDIKQTEGGTTVQRTEDDIFSTDLGGLLISQHIVEKRMVGTNSVTIDVTYSLGQVTPSELPAAGS